MLLLHYLVAGASLVQAIKTSLVTTRQPGVACPIHNGEALSACGDACYSRYAYACRCNRGDCRLVSLATTTKALRLYAANPRNHAVNHKPMTAGGLAWNIGGRTLSYCPENVKPNCPAGDVAVVVAEGLDGGASMSTMVPGGQLVYLTADFTVGYTQAHSGGIPPGAVTTGFRAYENGGMFNVRDGLYGWAVCGEGEVKKLHVRNSTNEKELKDCVGLNLRVEKYDKGYGAWQYT